MARESFSSWNKKQNKYEEQEFKRQAKAETIRAKQMKRDGYVQSESEIGDTNIRLNHLSQMAADIKAKNKRNSQAYKSATKLLKSAVNSENNLRQSTQGRVNSPSLTPSRNNPIIGQNSYYNRLQDMATKRRESQYTQAVNKQEQDRKAYLYKYGDVDNMSGKEISDRIKKLENEKAQREAERQRDAQVKGNVSYGSGAGAGNISSILNNKGLSKSQLETMSKLDADADDKLEVYRKALPQATLRDEEKKLTDKDRERIEKVADFVRGRGSGTRIMERMGGVVGGSIANVRDAQESEARATLDDLKKKGIDTDYLVDSYAIMKNNAEAEANAKASEDWAKESTLNSVLSSAATILASPFTSIQGAAADISHATRNAFSDKPLPVDQSSRWASKNTQAIRQGVSEKIDNPVWSFIYNAGMSTGDSAMALLTGSALGGASMGSKVTQAIMSAGAADQTYNEALDRGLDVGHALATALTAGVAEWATEKYSIDGLKKMASARPDKLRTAIMNIGKQMATEGSEEAASDVFNAIGDAIINGKKSEFNQKVKEYRAQGLTQEQARKAAMMDWLSQTAYDAAAGALSGGIMGAGAQAMGYNQVSNELKSEGITIAKAGELSEVIDYAKQFKDLTKEAKKADSERGAGALAETIEKKIIKDVSETETAEELQAVYEVLSVNAPSSVGVTIESAVRDKATELSEKAEGKEKEALEGIYETATDNYINASNTLEQKLQEGNNETNEGRVESREIDKGVAVNNRENEEKIEQTHDSRQNMDGSLLEETKEAQPETNEEVYTPTEVTEQGKTVEKVEPKIVGNKQARLIDSGENVTIEGFVQTGVDDVQVKIDGDTDTVALKDLEFSDPFVERMYQVAAKFDDAAAASAMISNYDGKQNTAVYAENFEKAYNYGTVDLSYDTMMKKTPFVIPESLVKLAYSLGKNHAEEVSEAKTVAKGTGTAVDERDEIVKGDGYGDLDKALAKKLGVDIKLVDKAKDENGKYTDKINGYLDISKGQMVFTDAAESKLGVRIHETMEFIDAVDPETYSMLMQIVFGYMAKETNLNSVYDMVMNYRDTYREAEGSKTFNEALGEFMNDAISGVFMSEDGAKDFIAWVNGTNLDQQEKNNIFKAAVKIILDLIDKIKDSLSYLTKAQKVTANMQIKSQEEIRDIFFDAAERAIEKYQNGEAKAEEKIAASRNSVKVHSIKVSESGIPYVEIDTDQELFDGLTRAEQGKLAEKIIRERFRGKVIGTTAPKNAYVTREGAGEFRFSAKQNPENISSDKYRTSPELDNLLEASSYKTHKDADGRHPKYPGGQDVYATIYHVGKNWYYGEMLLNVDDKGRRVFKDLTQIEWIPESNVDQYLDRQAGSFGDPNSIIPQQEKKASKNRKNSLKVDTEGRELSKGQQEYFKDSKAVDKNGNLLVLYHQTGSDFTVFDTRRTGAGSSDNETPYGVFLKSTPEDIGLKGKKQMKLYANITSPLIVRDREQLRYTLSKMSSEYETVMAEHDLVDKRYNEEYEKAENATWNYMTEWANKNDDIKNRADIYEEDDYKKLDAEENRILQEWSEETGKISKKAKDIITDTLRAQGYDGVFLSSDKGSFGRSTDAFIALDPEQVKNVDNVNPTSDADIRKSLRMSLEGNENTEDLVKENKHLKEAVEILKKEFELTDGKTPDESKIRTAAGRILKKYSSKFDKDTLVQNITQVYKYLRQDEADFDEALKVMSEIAKGVLQDTELKDTSMKEQYKDLYNHLTKEGIYLSDTQLEELGYTGGTTQFKRDTGIKINKEGKTTLDQQWQEWEEEYPELFPAGTNEGDMPYVLAGILDSISERIETLDGNTIDQMAYDVAMDIYGELAKVPVKETFADTKEKEKDQALSELADSYEKILEDYREDIRKEKAETEDGIKDQIEQERKRREAQIIAKIKDNQAHMKVAKDPKTLEGLKKKNARLEESLKRARSKQAEIMAEARAKYVNRRLKDKEGKYITETKNKIRKLHEKFRSMMLHPKKDMYIPKAENLVQAAVQMLKAVDLGATPGTNLYQTLVSANDMYDELSNDPDYAMTGDFSPIVANDLKRVRDIFKADEEGNSKNIYDLTAGELSLVYECMEELYTTIRNTTKLIRERGTKDAVLAGERIMKDLEDVKGLTDKIPSKVNDALAMNFLNPYRIFRRLSGYKDNSELMDIYKELNEGQRKMYQVQMEAEQKLQEFNGKKENEKFLADLDSKKGLVKVPLHFESGNAPVYITKGMRLALIMHGKSQANFEHMQHGGVTIPADMEQYSSNKKKAYTKERKVLGITRESLREMEDSLSTQERELLKVMEDYFWNWSGEQINKTSMELYGFKKARVHNYYPITVNKKYVVSDMSGLQMDATIEGMGFLKERQQSVDPIVLDSIIDAAKRTKDSTARFVGLAIPVRNFNKILNIGTWVESEAMDPTNIKPGRKVKGKTVKGEIEEVWGKRASKFIENVLKDLQQSRRKDFDLFDKIKGNYAGAVLTANASVIIKQTSAYPTCAGVMGWSPTLKAMFRGGVNNHPLSKADQELINRYTSLYWYRNQGNNTKELADIRDTNALVNRIKPVRFVKDAIQKVDMAMVGRFWYAAQYWVDANRKDLKKGTDEYYYAVAEIFNQTLEETQSTNMALQNAEIMKSDGYFARLTTLFMGQGLQNFGIVYDNLFNYRAKKEQFKAGQITKEELLKARKGLRNAISSQMVAAGVFAGLAIVARGLLHKMNPYRDEDKDITAESILLQWLDDVADNIVGAVPLGSFTYEWGKSIFTHERVYGTNDVVLQALMDCENSTEKMFKAISKGEGVWESVLHVAEDTSKLFGVPVENVSNLFKGTIKHVQDAVSEDGFLSFESDANRTATMWGRKLVGSIEEGDRESAEKYTEALVDMGKSDTKIIGMIVEQIKKQDKIQEAADVKVSDPDKYSEIKFDYVAKGYPESAFERAVASVIKSRNKAPKETEEEKKAKAENTKNAMMQAGSLYDALLETENKQAEYSKSDMRTALEDGNQKAIDTIAEKIYKETYEKIEGKDEEKKKEALKKVRDTVYTDYHRMYKEATSYKETDAIKKKLQKIKAAGVMIFNQETFEKWEKERKKLQANK